jgi:soluble lytic murein transglycosylase-like protein
VRTGSAISLAAWIGLAAIAGAVEPAAFVPAHRIPGVGVERKELNDELLAIRTQRMIDAQTFGIMREGGALPGARRIVDSPKLQSLFQSASEQSGIPKTEIEAIAYLESFGDPNAQSPAGPKGIMQIAIPTAHDMGLVVVVATRYRVTKQRVAVTKAGHTRYKTVTRRTPYTVMVRDDRLIPDRAIPAAAMYLAKLERAFGGRDWAIFAYHCGVGCVSEMIGLTRKARGVPADQITVPRMFFSATPAWNRELYSAIEAEMLRDYSPTYYFRIMRVQELLALYRSDPKAFADLSAEYRSNYSAATRPPHRLALWLTPKDLIFRRAADIQADAGQRLAPAADRPFFLGFSLRLTSGAPAEATPAALGTLEYLAYETRRLYQSMQPGGDSFRPLEVTSLVEPEDAAMPEAAREALSHTSGEVFDIALGNLPTGELECLRFILDDLGWDGYIGFFEEGRDSLHIGCAPAARDFFTSVFQEAGQ